MNKILQDLHTNCQFKKKNKKCEIIGGTYCVSYDKCPIIEEIAEDLGIKIDVKEFDRENMGRPYILSSDIPEDVVKVKIPSDVKRINSYTFQFLQHVKIIEIPENVIEIGKGAFVNCPSLKHITMTDSLKDLPDNLFCFDLDLGKNSTRLSTITFRGLKSRFQEYLVDKPILSKYLENVVIQYI